MDTTNELIVNSLPKSPISETFRLFRTNLLYLFNGENGKVLDVTSSEPGDGKSWVTANIAVAFAQFGMKVLIIDADLRKGRQHTIFNKLNTTGLSDYLRGLSNKKKNKKEKEDETKEFMNLVLDVGIENLSLMPAGPVPYNPSELLGSDKIDKLLEIAKENFDLVIFDTPPVSILADSLVICKKVDYVLLVAAANKTKREVLLNSKKAVEGVGGKIAGIVLNQIPPENNKSLYQSYEKYGNKKKEKKENKKLAKEEKKENKKLAKKEAKKLPNFIGAKSK